MKLITYFWLIIIFNILSLSYSEEYFKATKIECFPELKYFVNHTCRLKPVNRYKTLAFMDTFIRNILRNVSVNMGLYFRNDVNIFKPFLVNITQNMCWYLSKMSWGPYLNIFMKSLNTFSNVNHTCPYTGRLFLKNGYLDRKLIPVSFPRGAYKLIFNFYEGYPYDYIGRVVYYVELLEKK